MWRCAAFFVAASAMCGLTARADYLYVKIDLSQVYQNIPSMPGGAFVAPQGPGRNAVGPPRAKGVAVPQPIPIPGGQALPPAPPPPQADGPYVWAVIEMKSKAEFDGNKKDENGAKNGALKFDHQWGKNGRFVDTPALTPNIIKYITITKDSAAREFDKRYRKELAAAKDPRKYQDAAMWALQHGLPKEFHGAMDEMAKLDPKSPVVANYHRVQAGLKKAPKEDDPAAKSVIAELKRDDGGRFHAVSDRSGFYFALTNQQPNFDDDTRRRLLRLNQVMESFYYWFALNDRLLQPAMPQYRQLLVVANSAEDFYAKHSLWGSPTFSGNGLTPRRDNFILMSARPIDDVYRVFSTNNQELWKKLQISQDWFIKGTVWEADRISESSARDPFNIAFTQTLTIVQKAIEDEAELATLSREGARQLLFASGVLPRQVHTPEWVAEGLASYFETPQGALYHGVGLPSWSNLVTLKYLRMTKKLDRPAEVLSSVVTDRYYRGAQKILGELVEGVDKDNKLGDQLHDEMELANSTSWAFVYYLIERTRQPHLLMRYCQELNVLPRDMDLDDRALEACFAKVFDIADPTNPSRVDAVKFAAMADAWFAEMAGVSLEVPELQNEYLDIRKAAAKKKTAAN